jgi:hypothetical protein
MVQDKKMKANILLVHNSNQVEDAIQSNLQKMRRDFITCPTVVTFRKMLAITEANN